MHFVKTNWKSKVPVPTPAAASALALAPGAASALAPAAASALAPAPAAASALAPAPAAASALAPAPAAASGLAPGAASALATAPTAASALATAPDAASALATAPAAASALATAPDAASALAPAAASALAPAAASGLAPAPAASSALAPAPTASPALAPAPTAASALATAPAAASALATASAASSALASAPAAASVAEPLPAPLWKPPPRWPELPSHWTKQLPSFQQDWIRKALFRSDPNTGRPELVEQLKLWWYPPQAPLVHTHPPASPDLYFCRPLFLWMPHKMWSIPLVCIQPTCGNYRLTAAGLYRTVRRVLDVDGWYDMATEYLECKRCKKKYPGWSEDILNQLDVGHRYQFPAILTYRYSCDYRVVRMMRERTQGNSVTQLYKKLSEGHNEAWADRALQYLTACEPFTRSDIVERPNFSDPPPLPSLPKPKWLLSVYSRDVLSRLDEVKAKITSVFGSVLKMVSTKKLTKKLAGVAAHTAAWCTTVGNEHGQVLCSVLTAAEGHGLWPMAAGLMRRYTEAGVAPPAIMYVDRDCCSLHGQSRVKAMFREWNELQVHLDIWHFMRRFAAGVNNEAHQLYRVYMARLSGCIFEWDPDDVAALRRAKQGELLASGVGTVSDRVLNGRISRKELALHCRRRTRGVKETSRLIKALIDEMDGDGGRDTQGVPLLDHERIQQIWKEQQKHIACIQDPQGFPLYLKTGTLKKGGVKLCTYRCARGSTSLESFHLHLIRFIPGRSASDAQFQAYLLEGLMRWNKKHMEEAVKTQSTLWTYSSTKREALDRLSCTILGKSLVSSYHPPGAYTGEQMGIEYLYSQTGAALTVVESAEKEDMLVEQLEDEQVQEEEEGFVEENTEDFTVPVLFEPHPSEADPLQSSSTFQLPAPGPASPQPSTSSHVEEVTALLQPSAPDPSSGTDAASESSAGDQSSALVLGPDGAAGWDKVQDLAEYLVSLREVTYLEEQQVTDTIRLWTALPDGDKRRVCYQPRHQFKLTQGRFKASKGSCASPGVESVKRSLIGHPGGPARWPSTTRLVEAMCIKLCELHRSPTKRGGVTTPRWTKILWDYHHIRDLMLSCPTVMDATSLQLYMLNQRALIQWFQRRQSTQELSVIQQDLAAEAPIPVAGSQLPAPRERPDQTPSTSGAQHHFVLPPNTVGQSPKLQLGRRPASATTVQPTAPATPRISLPVPPQLLSLLAPAPLSVMFLSLAAGPSVSLSAPAPPGPPAPAPTLYVPPNTQRNRNRRRRAEEEDGGISKRKYVRQVAYNKCSKCGQPKIKEFGHSHYGKEFFCSRTSGGKTVEEWLAEQRLKEKPPS